MHHLLSLADLEQDFFLNLVSRSCALARPETLDSAPLSSRCIGLEFRKTSTRTRTSFAVAAVRLGACPIIYGPADLQTNTGETAEDTVSVLGNYLSALVIRSAGDPLELRRMAAADRLPIINAMTADEHPTQGLSDIAMITRRFGSLVGLRLLYSGEANSTAVALAYAISRCKGMIGEFRAPEGYGFPSSVLANTVQLSKRYGGTLIVSQIPPRQDVARTADVVYGTRWQTTGTTKSDPCWRNAFAPFRITASMLDIAAKSSGSVFMHDLPAVRDEDCDASVLDGSRSIAFAQAQQKLFTAMAVIEACAASN